MLHKTTGIALKFIKYKESSIIAQIFTEHFGTQSYIVNSVRSTGSKVRMSLFLPLTLLDLVVYHNEKKQIQRISEIKCHYPYKTIHSDIRKSSICLFVDEVLTKVLKNESHPEKIFHVIRDELIHFDSSDKNIALFHIKFLVKMASLLGFQVYDVDNLIEDYHGSYTLGPVEQDLLRQLIQGFDEIEVPHNQVRMMLLDVILSFYEYHVPGFSMPKSLSVLKDVLH